MIDRRPGNYEILGIERIAAGRGQRCAAAALIIHRDLKPSNVLLVSEPARPHGERAQWLDTSCSSGGTR